MSRSPTAAKIESAHETLAKCAGTLALALARGRGLSRTVLREIIEDGERALALLRTVAGD